MANRSAMQNMAGQPEMLVRQAGECGWNQTEERLGKPVSGRWALMAMLGDDPECDDIDCRTQPLLDSVSDNFRITIADVARYIMELKQGDVA